MTRDVRELDPGPSPQWRETSQPGIRRLALQACQAAITAAKDRRKQPTEESV